MKKIFSVLLCVLLIFSITACGNTEITTISTSNTSLGENGEITDSSNGGEDKEELNDDIQGENSSVGNQEVSSSNKGDTNYSSFADSSKINHQSSSKKPTNATTENGSKVTSKDKNTTSTGKSYPVKQKTIIIRKNNIDKFKTIGRCVNDANSLGISLNWSCSSVEFNLDCTKELAIEVSKGSSSHPLYIEIYLDGKAIAERTNVENTGRITIASNLEPGVHNLKIVRQTDVDGPTLTIHKIYAYGNLVEAPKNKPLYIEAIGDAGLIGWGVRLDDSFFKNPDNAVVRNRMHQDGTLAYSYVAAEKLGADSYTFARQGAGFVATYHKANNLCVPRSGILPTMYEFAHISGGDKNQNERLPDVFVLDAGAADLNGDLLKSVEYDGKIGIDIGRATELTTEFLKRLKKINPKAKIIWCYGMEGENPKLENHILNITKSAGGEATGIYALKLPKGRNGDYPSVEDHQAAATVLANKIRQIIK